MLWYILITTDIFLESTRHSSNVFYVNLYLSENIPKPCTFHTWAQLDLTFTAPAVTSVIFPTIFSYRKHSSILATAWSTIPSTKMGNHEWNFSTSFISVSVASLILWSMDTPVPVNRFILFSLLLSRFLFPFFLETALPAQAFQGCCPYLLH